MADHDDRDRAIERLLPQVLGGAASTPCVDGETLAAWSEGALRPNDAALVEAHVADCARCQAMVGAFVRISPAPVVTESLWQQWRLNWLLPLATAAAAVALWAVIPSTSPGRQEAQVTLADARSDVPTPAATPPPPPAVEREAAPVAAPTVAAPSASSDRRAAAQESQFADRLERRQVQNEAAAPADALAKKKERDENATAEPPKTLVEAVTVTGAAPAVETSGTTASQRARNDAPAEPVPAQPVIQQRKAVEERVAAAPPAAAAPAAPARPLPTATAAGGRAAATDRAAASGRTAELGMTLNATAIEISTPVASTRWRLAAASGVQRTTNNGATWVDVPGVDVNPLRAGSAPTVNVCWIVGTNGRVYLTTDGLRFTRVTFPEAIDLVAVQATDARVATVTAADGRSFRTTDGGANWTR